MTTVRKLSKQMTMTAFNLHFPRQISKGLQEFVREDCLIGSRYLFVSRIHPKIRAQRGFCTHCKAEYVVHSDQLLKHNATWACESCKSLVTVKSAGLGRGKMVDKGYVIWYDKSKADPDAIICTGYKIVRDYRESIDIETEYVPVMRCIFKPGFVRMAMKDHYTTGFFRNQAIHFRDKWKFAAEPHSLMGRFYFTYYSYQSIASVHAAIAGTSFQYSPWSRYAKENMDLVVFFSAFVKYPFLEYLVKMGMADLADQIVKRYPINRAVNVRGKTMERILGLSKQEIKEWRATGVKMDASTLRAFKYFRDHQASISWELASKCGVLLDIQSYGDAMKSILKYTSLDQLIRYADRQQRKHRKAYFSIASVITDWRDYLQECLELDMDVTQDRFLFPNSLYAAHRKTQAKVKLKHDPLLDTRIGQVAEKWGRLSFENGNYLIRPIASLTELFDEGGQLVHCVGSYADPFAKGQCLLLCIRQVHEPDQPYFTLELSLPSLNVVQCRGFENCAMSDEVQDFVNQFVAKKLLTRRKRIDTTGMMPQEAIG